MSHPETIDTIALLALRPSEDMTQYVKEKMPSTGILTPENAYRIVDDSLAVDSIGCPAAGHVVTESHKGEVKPLQIFKRLIPWGTEVQLISKEWRKFRIESARNLDK